MHVPAGVLLALDLRWDKGDVSSEGPSSSSSPHISLTSAIPPWRARGIVRGLVLEEGIGEEEMRTLRFGRNVSKVGCFARVLPLVCAGIRQDSSSEVVGA